VYHIRDFFGLVHFFQKSEPIVNNFFHYQPTTRQLIGLTDGHLIVLTSEKGKKLEWVKKYFQIMNGRITKGQTYPYKAPFAWI
jgi:hypothetical protein